MIVERIVAIMLGMPRRSVMRAIVSLDERAVGR
jgi:hypothetical protein